MYITHIVGMVLCVGKEFYVIQILELFYVEIIIFPVIFDGQTHTDPRNTDRADPGIKGRSLTGRSNPADQGKTVCAPL